MNKLFYLQNGLIALAIIFTGFMAGFFWTYTFNVNYAMLLVDGETYATMQSLFNQNVRHTPFYILFFGSGVVSAIAALANIRQYKSATFWLLAVAATVYIAGIILFTKSVNLPLNAYTESWNPSDLPTDWAATRAAWNSANALRVVTSSSSFALCVVALMSRVKGR